MFPSRRIATMGGDKFKDEYSLEFDGINDYVDFGDSADYHHDNGSASLFSVSIWVKITSSTNGDDTFISKYDYGANKREWRISVDASQNIKFASSSNGTDALTATSSNALDNNRWYHIVLAYNGVFPKAINRPAIYLDSVKQSLSFSGTQPAQINEDDAPLTVGCMLNSGNAASTPPANVSEATFYNAVLSASQVKTLYNGREPYNHKEGVASSNLTAWWRMGDGLENAAGTTIYDASSNTNNGTVTNMAANVFIGDTP